MPDDNSLWFFIQPGEALFMDEPAIFQTTLGSCVAITIWHPKYKYAGMCHYVLPSCNKKDLESRKDLRYADNAVAYLHNQVIQSRTFPKDYQVGVYGAIRSRQLSRKNMPGDVALRNIDVASELLLKYKFTIDQQETGVDCDYQKVYLDSNTGAVKTVNGTG